MRIDRVDQWIDVMRRADRANCLCQIEWQAGDPVNTEHELHACGNTACAAGNLAVSPEWIVAGGTVLNSGKPAFGGFVGVMAIQLFLECDYGTADSFIYGDLAEEDETDGTDYLNEGTKYSIFYDKEWGCVTAQDVIDKLEDLKKCN